MSMDSGPQNHSAARTAIAIATLGGIGFSPAAPGTVASIVSLPFAWAITWFAGRGVLLGASVLALLLGAWACELYARAKGQSDPSECVVDELAGQWIACAFAPFTLVGFGLAFFLFRVFDILKPWPISWLEKELPGGAGIMADDVAAGVAAGVILMILTHLGFI
jgi:phosphatidylglycerophosphatase A